MKKLLLLLSVFTLALTGCEDNEDSPGTILTSEITVDGAAFKPSQSSLQTFVMEGDGEEKDHRSFSLAKGSGENVTQALYVNLELPHGRSNDGGSYIFHIGETATNLFASGTYVEGDVAYSLAGGTVHVTEMTDGYFKLVFEDVQARNPLVNGGFDEKFIEGEFKGKFAVQQLIID